MFILSKWKTGAFYRLRRLYAGSRQKWETVVRFFLPGRGRYLGQAEQADEQQPERSIESAGSFQSAKAIQQAENRQSNKAVRQADKPVPSEKRSLFSAWAGGLGGIFPRGYLLLAGAYIFALLLLLAVFTAKQGKIPFLELPGRLGNGVEYGLPAENAGCKENEKSNDEPKGMAEAEADAGSGKSTRSTGSGESAGSVGSNEGARNAGSEMPAGSGRDLQTDAGGSGGTAEKGRQTVTAAGTPVTSGDTSGDTAAVAPVFQAPASISVPTLPSTSPPSQPSSLPQAASPLPVWEVYRAYGEHTSNKLPSGGTLHTFTRGLDLIATPGAPVAALWDGRVSKIGSGGSNGGGDSSPYSQFVVLEHDGDYVTFYGNLREVWVEEGSSVYRGEHIGLLPHSPPTGDTVGGTAQPVSAVAAGSPAAAVTAPAMEGQEETVKAQTGGNAKKKDGERKSEKSGGNTSEGKEDRENVSSKNMSGGKTSGGNTNGYKAYGNGAVTGKTVPLNTIYKGAPDESRASVSSARLFEAGNPLLYLEVRQGHSYLDPLFFIGVRN